MIHFNHQQLADMQQRYRARFINSLSGFKSANLIGTIDRDGLTNVAIFSSVVHLGASPALIACVSRPNSADRHTLENIKQTGCYTINHVNDTCWLNAHQTSARYVREESEFNLCGLSCDFIEGIEAPFVGESQLKYALKLKEIMPIPFNKTELVIGEITDVFCDSKAIQEDGYIDIESLGTVAVSGLDSYHVTNRLSRVSYAKPDSAPRFISLDGKLEKTTESSS